ncbi:hypothetical protein [Roseinatronobacter sp. S2]|uniref:hypothetical protein n=1 Tax=Roseinatronobacter sp. S2 TaxID=3035471 RepID=UPI00240FD580|nr:hypothetical protein [Roseinatronobacter sp. S2]WFE76548.1 hypothetical protein P8S53_18690 [Roseinatronobacter sp. S2]
MSNAHDKPTSADKLDLQLRALFGPTVDAPVPDELQLAAQRLEYALRECKPSGRQE